MCSLDRVKVVLLGSAGVGKTCLLTRLEYDRFDGVAQPTIGVEFLSKRVDSQTRLQFWDTAGSDRFRSEVSFHAKDSSIALVVFDLTDRDSYKQATTWIGIARTASPAVTVVIVGNKSDSTRRTIATEEASAKAEEVDALYLETSAQSGQGVRKLMEEISKKAKESMAAAAAAAAAPRLPTEKPAGRLAVQHWRDEMIDIPLDDQLGPRQQAWCAVGNQADEPSCFTSTYLAVVSLAKALSVYVGGAGLANDQLPPSLRQCQLPSA
jgi:Ras-related protein Rab-6A